MLRTTRFKILGLSILAVAAGALLTLEAVAADQPENAALDTARIEQLTGLKGTLNDQSGVFRVALPRSDLSVTVAGVHMNPDLGLTAWTAFSGAGAHTEIMGDIVLLENEVNPVLGAALDGGLQVTALHNHFLWDSPRLMFMHITGSGDEASLARGVGNVYDMLRKVIRTRPDTPEITIDPASTSFDTKAIDTILGASGTLKNGVYKVVLGRNTSVGGHEMGKDMGVNTWAAFAGSEQQAVVDGDFAMLEGEVQGVLKALRAAHISVVALHSHMLGESPRMVFLHYWGVGSLRNLATGLKSALNTQAGSPPP